ncbi:Wiskott-Aldrich syndrome protein family member 2 like [Quillaja saponaria]|uniref:Wiskott-Aldrich syndrome protein family member 2 like n=1 Tax=Quillaja saponaria TaxID=32244 RepID=A0AAD7KVQ1_QUISA|nr:Wiskott-Aldrich syndrome protein family member 2 like [Quillaja saponaria]
MERQRISRQSSTLTLQKKILETRRRRFEPQEHQHVAAADITDFMNDMFFGTVNVEKKVYDLKGGVEDVDVKKEEEEEENDDVGFDDSIRSNSSRLTEEWLEEARRIVASSPARSCDSPNSRLSGSPRFAAHAAAASQGRSILASSLDRRDPLSRSARRHRALESFSGEILSKSAKHARNKSENFNPPSSPTDPSPASAVQKWFSNLLKPNNSTPSSNPTTLTHHPIEPPNLDPTLSTLPPRQSVHRKSRFQTDPSAVSQGIPVPSRRTFRSSTALPYTQLLSPPKNIIQSANRRSLASSTCALPENQVLSPPKNLVESAHRRSISSSTCSQAKISPRADGNGSSKEGEGNQDVSLNGFLKEKRNLIEKISNGELNLKAKIVLSGPSNSTTSMVAAICYAWLLENRQRKKTKEGDGRGYVVLPVINVKRGRMWKLRQASWLFYHTGLDTASLLFADEVDLESLMMAGQLNILVVGQDVLQNTGEVGSQCTILTDNYCEDAYDLLQTPVLKKLLLAGILLDTQNLKNASTTSSMTRDAEAVQLLLVGSAPNYRNALFDQLMLDQKDASFMESLRLNHGKSPKKNDYDNGLPSENFVSERKSTSISPHEAITEIPKKNSVDAKGDNTNLVSPKSATVSLPSKPPSVASAQPAKEASRGKNKFFLAKWFGFGSK